MQLRNKSLWSSPTFNAIIQGIQNTTGSNVLLFFSLEIKTIDLNSVGKISKRVQNV